MILLHRGRHFSVFWFVCSDLNNVIISLTILAWMNKFYALGIWPLINLPNVVPNFCFIVSISLKHMSLFHSIGLDGRHRWTRQHRSSAATRRSCCDLSLSPSVGRCRNVLSAVPKNARWASMSASLSSSNLTILSWPATDAACSALP